VKRTLLALVLLIAGCPGPQGNVSQPPPPAVPDAAPASEPEPEPVATTCDEDSDCAPACGCHPGSCQLKATRDCERVICTTQCVPGTLDCGQGACVCEAGSCEAKLGMSR
jgi:hypothetical protein